MTTPTPNQAPIIEAMAEALTRSVHFGSDGDCDMAPSEAKRAIDKLRDLGFVLVPRAEVEEAADRCWAEHRLLMDDPLRWHACLDFKDLANRLRERSRG